MKSNIKDTFYIQYLAGKYRIKSITQAEPEYMTFGNYGHDYRMPTRRSNSVTVEIGLEALAHLAKKIYEQDIERETARRHQAVSEAYDKYQTLVALYKGVV